MSSTPPTGVRLSAGRCHCRQGGQHLVHFVPSKTNNAAATAAAAAAAAAAVAVVVVAVVVVVVVIVVIVVVIVVVVITAATIAVLGMRQCATADHVRPSRIAHRKRQQVKEEWLR
eukprot:CAMPEP_0181197144 /NCGR_PEP_ID=MMETSP1096-20121128/15871_1 /TAXON_ID=156174 ORGANISM="Chrysochromulina ericina, Strain CCMP281" /NCGR_SAMPLE_ID=MMETSP1096 /ASSEMBLY_ACC=CAM_ASM_000453 /LENGTH=114 /DNA_ID=CAMNT_0023287009 /DNA_START=561 /DNA_END=906 /DNA_ORIENTATION=+